jgi:hypothetical protein
MRVKVDENSICTLIKFVDHFKQLQLIQILCIRNLTLMNTSFAGQTAWCVNGRGAEIKRQKRYPATPAPLSDLGE